jgi:hypothetical protein
LHPTNEYSSLMVAAYKNQWSTSGQEYRSIIRNLESPLKQYFTNGIIDSVFYIMWNPNSDFITSINWYASFDYTPNRIYFTSGFYFSDNDIGTTNSVLISTHSNIALDRVVVNGDTSSDTTSIVWLFVR